MTSKNSGDSDPHNRYSNAEVDTGVPQIRFLSIINALDYPFYVIDPEDYSILVGNSASWWKPGNSSVKCHALTHGRSSPCTGPDHPCPMEEAKNTGKPVVLQHHQCHESKGSDCVKVCGYPVRDGDGRMVQFVECMIEASDPGSAEHDLARRLEEMDAARADEAFGKYRAEERARLYAGAVGAARIGLFVYKLEDINDDRSLRMIEANPAAAIFTSVAVEDLIGRTIDELFPGLRDMGIPQKYAEVVRNGKAIDLDEVHYGDDRVPEGVFSVRAFPLPDYCVGIAFENITERKRAEIDLHYRMEFDSLVASLSTTFLKIRPDRIGEGIDTALEKIGNFTGADCCFLCESSGDRVTVDKTHEWCAEGVKPRRQVPKKLVGSDFPWFGEKLGQFEIIRVRDVGRLPRVADADREVLRSFGIGSLIVAPMTYSDSMVGFVGLYNLSKPCDWPESTASLLSIVGEMFVGASVRSRAQLGLQSANEQLRSERQALRDKNIAMREVLARFEEEKELTRQQIAANVEESLFPLISRIKDASNSEQKKLVVILEENLRDIASPFIDKLKQRFSRLTPREMEICHMISKGRSSKEIASILSKSVLTIHKHREQIRKKLGLSNSNINLNTFLQSL